MYPREPLDDDAVVVLEVPDLILMIIGGPPVVQWLALALALMLAFNVCLLLASRAKCVFMQQFCPGKIWEKLAVSMKVRKFQ